MSYDEINVRRADLALAGECERSLRPHVPPGWRLTSTVSVDNVARDYYFAVTVDDERARLAAEGGTAVRSIGDYSFVLGICSSVVSKVRRRLMEHMVNRPGPVPRTREQFDREFPEDPVLAMMLRQEALDKAVDREMLAQRYSGPLVNPTLGLFLGDV